MTWRPRTPHEALIHVDTTLARVTVGYRSARERIADTIPGHSGRPAGTGEPGGGTGGFGDTVVERCAARSSVGSLTMQRMELLADRIVERTEQLAAETGILAATHGPLDNGAVRRLTWARWAVRLLVELQHRTGRYSIADRYVRPLHDDVAELAAIVDTWRAPRDAPDQRTVELAVDDTERWCTSCLRVGSREPRSERYTSLGVCRWCGDFNAEQGFMPSLEILDARRDGRRVTTKMVSDAKPGKKRRKAKR